MFSDLLSGLKETPRQLIVQRIPNSNPRYRSIGKGMLGRRVFLNKVLSGGLPVRLVVSPKCKELISDFEECTATPNGTLAKPKTKEGFEKKRPYVTGI